LKTYLRVTNSPTDRYFAKQRSVGLDGGMFCEASRHKVKQNSKASMHTLFITKK